MCHMGILPFGGSDSDDSDSESLEHKYVCDVVNSGPTTKYTCGKRWGEKVPRSELTGYKPSKSRCPSCSKKRENVSNDSSVPGGVGGVTEGSGSWGDH